MVAAARQRDEQLPGAAFLPGQRERARFPAVELADQLDALGLAILEAKLDEIELRLEAARVRAVRRGLHARRPQRAGLEAH